MTDLDRKDLIFQFSFIMVYGTTYTFNQLADLIEIHNDSPQALALIKDLRGIQGSANRDRTGNVNIHYGID